MTSYNDKMTLVLAKHSNWKFKLLYFISFTGPNQPPQMPQYPFPNPILRHHDVDDLDEYRGGMERYRLSHNFDLDDDPVDNYPPRRPYEDDEDDEDDDDDEGKKKSLIGKPHNNHKKHKKTLSTKPL